MIHRPDAPAPLKPRPMLLLVLGIVLAAWIALLLVIYFTVVR